MKWNVDRTDLHVDSRSPGISGFMRLRNESKFLRAAIDSHLPHLDELILVYNNCGDDTPAICEDYAVRFPEKIRAIHYKPIVVPAGSPEYLNDGIPDQAEESLANYYNFALCQTTRKIAVKIDGDHIALSPQFGDLCARVRKKMLANEMWNFYGINIVPYNGELFLWADRDMTVGETLFFYVTPQRWHYYDLKTGYDCEFGVEVLDLGDLRPRSGGVQFIHMRALKSDLGFVNYLNPGNKGHEVFRHRKISMKKGKVMTVGQSRILHRRRFANMSSAPIENQFEACLHAHGITREDGNLWSFAKTSIGDFVQALWAKKIRRIKSVTAKSTAN